MKTSYEKSRKIRRLIDEGLTTKQIKKEMNLKKKTELYEIVKSEYSERFSKVLLEKLKSNDSFGKTKILVDTSALKVKGIVNYLLKYKKILLHTDVIREMDKFKESKNDIFGFNIRELLKRSAEDYQSNKVVIIATERISLYTDENLIQYLRNRKKNNIVLITDDNALACLARGYGIKYILARDLKGELKTTKKTVIETRGDSKEKAKLENPVNAKKSTEETVTCENINDTIKKVSLEFVELIGKNLYLSPPQDKENSFIVLEEGKIKKSSSIGIPLKNENVILKLSCTKKGKLQIHTFTVIDTSDKECAQDLGCVVLASSSDIEKMSYQDSVKGKLRFFFSLMKKSV